MNTETNIIPLSNEPPTPRRPRPHPTCKIGRLPAEIREMINESLANNLSYPEIIARLAASGYPDFTANNLCRWAYSGYLIWLQNHESKNFLRLHTDASVEVMRELDASDSNACSRENHVYMSTQLGQLLRGLNPKPLKRKLETDPAAFFRLVRSVNAQTRNTIRDQKIQRDAAKKDTARLAKQQRDLGERPPTTSPEGYAAAAAYYGIPPRFNTPQPVAKPTSENQQTN
jgi:hypothetical protein